MTRVLFTSPAAYGHVHTMIPLGRALIDQGHDVYWATGADMCERVEQAGIPAVAAGLSGPARVAEFRRRYPEQFAISPEKRRAFTFPRLSDSSAVSVGGMGVPFEPYEGSFKIAGTFDGEEFRTTTRKVTSGSGGVNFWGCFLHEVAIQVSPPDSASAEWKDELSGSTYDCRLTLERSNREPVG